MAGCNDDPPTPAPPATTAPSTAPTPRTAPTTTPAPLSYLDWAKQTDPALTAATLATDSVSVDRAARLLTDNPVYIDPTGRMWVHSPDAPPLDLAVARKADFPLLTASQVVLAEWGQGTLRVITTSPTGAEMLEAGKPARPIAGSFDWPRTALWLGHAVLPSNNQLTILHLPTGQQTTHTFPDGTTPVCYALASDGILAWRPWENGQPGSIGVWWWQPSATKFTQLPTDSGYAKHPVHLMPLTDGAILQLHLPGPVVPTAGASLPDAPLALSVAIPASTAAPAIAADQVQQLLNGLIDPDPTTRAQAYDRLEQAGPSVWKQLEAAAKDQPPEARLAINRVLGLRARPRLGTFRLLDGRVRVVSRLSGGGIIFYLPGGAAAVTSAAGETGFSEQVIEPALLWVRPGKRVTALPIALLLDTAKPETLHLSAFAEELILADPVKGPRRFMSNHLADLLPPELAAFSTLVAIDRDGRWLLQATPAADTPAPEPATIAAGQSTVRFAAPTPPPLTAKHLILDTLLADPRPRLLAWVVPVKQGLTGWTPDDHLAVDRGGMWQLTESTWIPLPPGTTLTTRSTANKTAIPGGLPAAFTAAVPIGTISGEPIKDGITHLQLPTSTLPLPPAATGQDGFTPFLMQDDKKRLWLMNSPGKIHVLTRDGSELTHLHTFARDIPSSDIRRIWKDPYGRVCIAHEDTVTVLFLDGQVPRALRSQVRGVLQ